MNAADRERIRQYVLRRHVIVEDEIRAVEATLASLREEAGRIELAFNDLDPDLCDVDGEVGG